MPSLANPDVRTTVQRIQDMIEDETVEIGKALKLAGRRAIKTLVDTMEVGSSEGLRFKAAQDLADRNPETSKTQKVAVTSFSLTSDDVKDLAKSMVEAQAGRAAFADVMKQDFVRVDVDRHEDLPEHAKRLEAADAARRQESPAPANVSAEASHEADEREDPPRDAAHDGQGA